MQIHYVKERSHWVASSYKDGKVELYDSLFDGKLAPSLQVQLAQLYGSTTNNSAICITAVAVQQQEGGVDCGLFSIAFAHCAASGGNVARLRLNQEHCRAHLSSSFEQQLLAPAAPTRMDKVITS